MKASAITLGLGSLLLMSVAVSSELIYQPINPNFGGSGLNGSFLLNEANAQNSFEDPDAAELGGFFDEQSTIDDFTESLNRLILSALSGLIVNEVFADVDDGGLKDGINTFATDGFSITIDTTGGKGLAIDVEDLITGESTSLAIPYF